MRLREVGGGASHTTGLQSLALEFKRPGGPGTVGWEEKLWGLPSRLPEPPKSRPGKEPWYTGSRDHRQPRPPRILESAVVSIPAALSSLDSGLSFPLGAKHK